MKPDLRSFTYALEVRRLQARWRLQALQVQGAEAQRERQNLLEAREAARDRLKPRTAADLDARSTPIDLVVRATRLAFLAGTRRREAELTQRIVAADEHVAQRMAEIGRALKEVDALDTNREACLAEHLAGQARREAREADQRWQARRAHRVNTGDPE